MVRRLVRTARCRRCDHQWRMRRRRSPTCPKCRSYLWEIPRPASTDHLRFSRFEEKQQHEAAVARRRSIEESIELWGELTEAVLQIQEAVARADV